MAAPPTRDAILHLYASTLRASRAFSSYNFRNYFLRRTQEQFRQIKVSGQLLTFPIMLVQCRALTSLLQNENDPAKLSMFFNKHVEELAVLKRSAIVNQLYGGWRLVVEKDKPEHVLERADS